MFPEVILWELKTQISNGSWSPSVTSVAPVATARFFTSSSQYVLGIKPYNAGMILENFWGRSTFRYPVSLSTSYFIVSVGTISRNCSYRYYKIWSRQGNRISESRSSSEIFQYHSSIVWLYPENILRRRSKKSCSGYRCYRRNGRRPRSVGYLRFELPQYHFWKHFDGSYSNRWIPDDWQRRSRW